MCGNKADRYRPKWYIGVNMRGKDVDKICCDKLFFRALVKTRQSREFFVTDCKTFSLRSPLRGKIRKKMCNTRRRHVYKKKLFKFIQCYRFV